MSRNAKLESLESRTLLSATSVQIGDTVYYADSDAAHGTELWRMDPDGSNKAMVADIEPGPGGSSPQDFFDFNGRLIFTAAAFDSVAPGRELWTSDGTARGTINLKDIYQGGNSSNPHDFTILNNRMLFLADAGSPILAIFATDGTPAGTIMLDPTPGTTPSWTYVRTAFGTSGGLFYFERSETSDLWQTDGTVAGTRLAGIQSVITDDGVLHVLGTIGNDDIGLSSSRGITTVTINGDSVQYNNSDFTSINIDGDNGNDRIFLAANVTQNATLTGGNGDDTLTGGGGNDLLDGGNGNDTADYSSETTALTMATVSSAPQLNSSDRGSDVIELETLLCGSGDDRISVTSGLTDGLQYIDGGAGNDSISLGRNSVAGGPTIHGGAGNDSIGGSDYDESAYLYGEDGDDLIYVEPRARTTYHVDGGAGYDIVQFSYFWYGDSPNNYLSTYPGIEGVRAFNGPVIPTTPPSPPPPPAPNSLPASSSAVAAASTLSKGILKVNGTTGNDRITLLHSKSNSSLLELVVNGKISNFTFSDVKKISVNASNGNDWINLENINIGATLLGGNGNDSIYGSQGADSIDGGRGNDSLCGFAGNDSITGGIGIDFIRGGEGTDRLTAQIGIDNTAKNKGDRLINQILA